MKVKLPTETAVDAEVDLCGTEVIRSGRASTSALPFVQRDIAKSLVDAAYDTCPYSKAMHGNMDVAINVV